MARCAASARARQQMRLAAVGAAAAVDGLIAELLQAYHGPAPARLYHGATVRRFLARVPGTDKTLGFDMPTPPNPSCGRFFPETGVGHLGFTGIDPTCRSDAEQKQTGAQERIVE